MWIKFIAQGHNTWCSLRSNLLTLDLESDALPLHHNTPHDWRILRQVGVIFELACKIAILADIMNIGTYKYFYGGNTELYTPNT